MSLLTVREVAAMLGLSTTTVYGLCARRQLRHERHGLGRGKILIPLDAINDYRESVTVGSEKSRPDEQKLSQPALKHLH